MCGACRGAAVRSQRNSGSMARDKKAREFGDLTLGAIGIVIGSIVDTMQAADVPNDTIHAFLDRLEDGFQEVLYGPACDAMLILVRILRGHLADND
jgi:hypothetical protein